MTAKFDRKLWIGIGISIVCVVLLLLKIDFDKLLAAFRAMDYRYLLPAVAFTFISYYFRAVRWRFLLLPIKKASMDNLFAATIIGYMANNLLPARLGEFVRAYALGEKEGADKSAVFATLVLDRLFDGFTVLLILLIAFFTVTLPAGMEKVQRGLVMGGYVTLALYLAVIVFLVVLKRYTFPTLQLIRGLLRPFPATITERVIPVLGSFIEGLRLSSRLADLTALFFSSLVIWFFALLPIDMVLRSFGITLPITASMFIMVFLVFAVMVPASPGYIGTYHYACVTGLGAFGIRDEKALSVALVIHAINFFPVILAGFYYLWRDNLSLKKLRMASSQQEN